MIDRRNSRLVMGIVTARSVSEPSPAGTITYTIEIDEEGHPVTYAGIVPQAYYRRIWVEAECDLIPFDVGFEVPIGISREGSIDRIYIMTGETPNAGPCDGAPP